MPPAQTPVAPAKTIRSLDEPQRMTHVAFAELKRAQGEIREALHGIDAIGTRPAAASSLHAADIDRIIEHLEAAVTRLRAIQESLGAER